jgi:flavin-dependent dehydrogenase
MAMELFDVVIVGGGPAGSAGAAFCAQSGLRTLLLEREKFPREKVCGDCLNPACWPLLRRLGIAGRIHSLPHGILKTAEFIGLGGQKVVVDLPLGEESEIAVKRSLFDAVLMARARELGVEIHEESTVTKLTKTASTSWKIEAGEQSVEARALVGADGRNSTVARFCNLLPRSGRERVALQSHIRLPNDFGNRVVLQFLPEGYSGQAPVNDQELNLCLVGRPGAMSRLRHWAERQFDLGVDHPWRTTTPPPELPPARNQQ